MSHPPTYEVTAHVAASASASKDGSATDLILRLAEEMAAAWRQGERPTVEEFLARYSELKEQPETALPLVCEEICLREEYGQGEAEAAVLERFAAWRASILQMLIAHRRQREERAGAGLPAVGESWADCYLLIELGRGAVGRVFLATQSALAHRPVVLKVSTCDAREHLSLARLQHTHIVPLYAVHDDAARNLRALCMPYFGGATLGQVLEALRAKPVTARTGQDMLDALDKFQSASPVAMPTKGPARTLLSKATYPQALCILGVCLAEALKYAHERGLVHLDIKPANVLLAADAQPMLLDFHLARAPLRAGSAPPDWFGGTPKYMSPEQRQATAAVKARNRDFPTVDERSDICSFGLMFYEALGGELPVKLQGPLPRLETRNPQVTTGLADVVHKCLEVNPEQRYADAGALATDLNRYLANRPLLGVRNRNLMERWRKWTRREPSKLARIGMVCGLLIAVLMGVNQVRNLNEQRCKAAERALASAQEQLRHAQHAEAVQTLKQGLHTTQELWWGGEELVQQFREQIQLTQRAQAVATLRLLTDRVRFLFGATSLPHSEKLALEASCRQVWEARGNITGRLADGSSATGDQTVQTDLLDLALLWTDLRLSLTPDPRKEEVRREVLRTLDEAETLFGPSVVLDHVRQRHAQALGLPTSARATERVPRTEWEYFALGRSLLNAGDLRTAIPALRQAVQMREGSFWPRFYDGTAAFQEKRYEDAARAFCACVALRPQSAECYYNRALAHRELGEVERALADFNRALAIDPQLGCAALNRGILHLEQDRLREAMADLELAQQLGAAAVEVHYNLAWVRHKQGDTARALQHVGEVLRRVPEHEGALALEKTLKNP